MSEPTGPVCPQCGTPRAADGTPSCPCGRQASDAHLDARAAQAAAAEDFDPVRIRPFVKVGDDPEPLDGSAVPAEAASAQADESVGSPADSEDEPGPRASADDTAQDGRRRRAALATGAGVAAVAVLVSAGLVGGLFSYEAPSRDGALPDDIRAGLPEAASAPDASSSSATPSATASSAQPSDTTATSPDATPTESGATPTGSTAPARTPSNSGATATAAPAPTRSDDQDPVLGFGDKGAEVTELQLRLRQIGFYNADIDGDYDRDVENAVRGYQLTRVVLEDEPGVYGEATRASLESETSQP